MGFVPIDPELGGFRLLNQPIPGHGLNHARQILAQDPRRLDEPFAPETPERVPDLRECPAELLGKLGRRETLSSIPGRKSGAERVE